MNIDDILKDFEQQQRRSVSGGDAEEEQRQRDFEELQRVWVAERASPELLPYEGGMMERILKRVREKVEFIEYNSIELEDVKDVKLKLMVVESEVERINFLIRSYLRTRLSKIDKFTIYIHNTDEELKKLNANEINYMERHFEILADLYNKLFLLKLPESLHSLDDNSGGINMVVEPQMDTPVFFKVKKEIDEVVTIGTEQIELTKNSIYLMRYSVIKHLVSSNQIALI